MPIRLTPAVKFLLIALFACFLIQQTGDQFFGTQLGAWFALVPDAVFGRGQPFPMIWQLVTYSFLHGDVTHLFLNLMVVAFMGGELEAQWGTKRFFSFWFFCVLFSAFCYLAIQPFAAAGAGAPMVGASGAIYGMLMAYGILFGERTLLFMMLFPMKAKHFVWVLAGIEFMTSIYSGRSGVASVAHLGGMAAGFGYLWGLTKWRQWVMYKSSAGARRGEREQDLRKERVKKAGQHLKLVINRAESQGALGPEDPSGTDDDPNQKNSPKTWH